MSVLLKRCSWLLLALFLMGADSVHGQAPGTGPDGSDATKTELTDLEVSPAAAPDPLLSWRLLPDLLDIEPGDAALLYAKAILLNERRTEQERQLVSDAVTATGEELDGASAPLMKKNSQQILRLVRAAALRERWTHESPGRTDNIFDMEMPEVDSLRSIGRLLSVQVRVDVAAGRYEEAVEGLRAGYVMGSRMGESDVLIFHLVGLAVRAMMDHQVAYMVQQEGAPNLYWALAEIPSAYETVRRPLEFEMYVPFRLFPELRDPKRTLATREQWNGMCKRFFELFPGSAEPGKEALTSTTMLALLIAPAAKHMEAETGDDAEQLKDIPVTVVVGEYLHDLVATRADAVIAALRLPFSEAEPRLKQLSDEVGRDKMNVAERTIALLLPSFARATRSAARADRRTAALMCVEAIRMHAAESGDLPERLEDITVVPVPRDPMTGKPFEYHLEGEGAILRQTDALARPDVSSGINYRIRLRK